MSVIIILILTLWNHIFHISSVMRLKWFEKTKSRYTQRQNKVCYKLKTCIVQTINSAYKGIFLSYTQARFLLKKCEECRYETHHQVNQWDSDTARGCDYRYWSGTGRRLGHMHISPFVASKRTSLKKQEKKNKESLFTKRSLCLSMANTWPRFFLLPWQGEVRVKVMILWAKVELAACVPVHQQLCF